MKKIYALCLVTIALVGQSSFASESKFKIQKEVSSEEKGTDSSNPSGTLIRQGVFPIASTREPCTGALRGRISCKDQLHIKEF